MTFQVLFLFCGFSACELLGGKRAVLFGLSEPKYKYAVDEYNRGYRRGCAVFNSTPMLYASRDVQD